MGKRSNFERIPLWRAIPSAPHYIASTDGRIRSIDREIATSNGQTRKYTGKEISPASRNQYGHLKGRIGGANRYFHILIAEAFFGPRPEGMHVAHNDGDPENNAVSNLRYATPPENNRDKKVHGTHRERADHPCARLSEKDVTAIRKGIAQGKTQSLLAKQFDVARTTVSAIATGRSWN